MENMAYFACSCIIVQQQFKINKSKCAQFRSTLMLNDSETLPNKKIPISLEHGWYRTWYAVANKWEHKYITYAYFITPTMPLRVCAHWCLAQLSCLMRVMRKLGLNNNWKRLQRLSTSVNVGWMCTSTCLVSTVYCLRRAHIFIRIRNISQI